MDLSIIIVNWNSAAYTAECVSSIRAATRGLQYEIIVVDNASTDNSIETLKLLPDVTLVASSHNAGFARANNLGYQHASGKALLFLNPDTYVQDAAIDREGGNRRLQVAQLRSILADQLRPGISYDHEPVDGCGSYQGTFPVGSDVGHFGSISKSEATYICRSRVGSVSDDPPERL
jgi:glycosyltransferase involved in cell wall biosynthesis